MGDKSTAIQPYRPTMGQAVLSYQDAKDFARVAVASRLYMVKEILNEDKALALIMMGRELGLGPHASLRGLYMVNGIPSVGSRVMAALVKASGEYDYETLEWTEKVARIQFIRYRGGDPIRLSPVSSFSTEDAEKAGLLTKKGDVWHAWRKNMLWARALTNGFNIHCPHLAMGMPIYAVSDAEMDDARQKEIETTPAVEVAEAEVIKDQITGEEYSQLVALATKVGSNLDAIKEHHNLADLSRMNLATWKAVMGVLRVKENLPAPEPVTPKKKGKK